MSKRRNQKPYEFTHMWNIKLKATNEQTRKTNKRKLKTQTTVWWLPEGREVGCGVVEDEGGDRR